MGYVTDDPHPGPSRLIGEEWIAHGYQTTPDMLTPDPCPICGSPNGTCTNATHLAGMQQQGLTQDDGE